MSCREFCQELLGNALFRGSSAPADPLQVRTTGAWELAHCIIFTSA